MIVIGLLHSAPLQVQSQPAQNQALGPNLLQNGDLTRANEHWITALSGGTAHASLEYDRNLPPGVTGKVARFAVTAVDTESWHVQFQQENLDLTEGEPYTVSFWAKSDRERPLSLNASVDKDDFRWIGLNSRVNLSTDWRKITLVFTPVGTLKNHNRMSFLLGDALGSVELAGIALQRGMVARTPGSNLLQNGDFTQGLSRWTALTIVAPAVAKAQIPAEVAPPKEVKGKVAQIMVTTAGKQNWSVQFFQGGLELTEGEPYTVSFWAKADQERSLAMAVGADKDDFHSVGLDSSVHLAAEWRKYSVVFTATRTIRNGSRLVFLLGDVAGAVDIAEVSLCHNTAPMPASGDTQPAVAALKSHPLLGTWQSYHRNPTLTSEEYQQYRFTFRADGTGSLLITTLTAKGEKVPKAATREDFGWTMAAGKNKVTIGPKSYTWSLIDVSEKQKLTLSNEETTYVLFREGSAPR